MFNPFRNKPENDDRLFFSTDLHCHVLPGIDDGAPTVEKGVELVKALKRWGIDRIIATPHVAEDVFPNTIDTITPAIDSLRHALDEAGIEVDLSHSAEFRIDDHALTQIATKTIPTMPGNRLLVENSFIQEPWNLDKTLFQLKVQGYRLILAHPERYAYYHGNRSRLSALHANGMDFQINVLSLAGYYGKEIKGMVEWLIDNNLVEYIGTDIHRQEHIEAIDRYIGSRDFRRHSRQLAPRLLNSAL